MKRAVITYSLYCSYQWILKFRKSLTFSKELLATKFILAESVNEAYARKLCWISVTSGQSVNSSLQVLGHLQVLLQHLIVLLLRYTSNSAYYLLTLHAFYFYSPPSIVVYFATIHTLPSLMKLRPCTLWSWPLTNFWPTLYSVVHIFHLCISQLHTFPLYFIDCKSYSHHC